MGWTAPATWTVGELVLASKMNTHVRDNLNSTLHVLVRKTADEAVNNSTVLQDDNHLFMAMAANEVWYARFVLILFTTGVSADHKIAFTVPSGATISLYTAWDKVGSAGSQTLHFTASAAAQSLDSTNVNQAVEIGGIVVNGGTAGNLQLQWAQVTATVSDTFVRANSILMATKLA